MNTIKTHKKWLLGVTAMVSAGILFHAIIWLGFTRELILTTPRSGDLTRVGYITGSSYQQKVIPNLPRKHFENVDYHGQAVDMITLGDSFSNGCGKEGPYYQDWIATLHEMNVMNIQRLSGMRYLETLEVLLKSGYFDLIKPKYLLIETHEQNVVEKYANPATVHNELSLEEILNYYQYAKYLNKPPDISFINMGNLKFILYSFLYRFKENAFFSKVYTKKLSRPFFSVKNADKLIFMHEDFDRIPHMNDKNIKLVNKHLNQLAAQLEQKGIQLYFMPVPNKFSLYYDYILDKNKPKSPFFAKIRNEKKRYHFIDTKKILSEAVRNGEKDVFYADDTHWAPKAPQIIFERVRFN